MQSVDHHKTATISIVSGLVVKLLLTVPLIILFSKISFIPTYYGSITATILAYIVPIAISLIDLKRTLKISFKETFKKTIGIVISCITMIISLSLLKLLLPLDGGKIYSLVIVAIYAIIGGGIYLFITSKMHIFESIFECNIKDFIKRKFRR